MKSERMTGFSPSSSRLWPGEVYQRQPERMSGARIVIETLIEQGVTDVFGYPGGQVLNIYDELYRASDRLNHFLTAHEQGASHRRLHVHHRHPPQLGLVLLRAGLLDALCEQGDQA